MRSGGGEGAIAMRADGARWRLWSTVVGVMLLVGACAHHRADDGSDEEINAFPTNYKPDILGAMHVYLSDPTGIRDSAISQPMLKSVGNANRYVVCLRFNAKKSRKDYAGVKELAAVFLAGHFDHFVETASEQCAGASYAPFPELEKLSR
jgi:hypothetical protein